MTVKCFNSPIFLSNTIVLFQGLRSKGHTWPKFGVYRHVTPTAVVTTAKGLPKKMLVYCLITASSAKQH